MFSKNAPKLTRNQAQRLIKLLTAIRDGKEIPSIAAIDLDVVETLHLHLDDELEKSAALRRVRQDLERLWLSSSSGRTR
jgi:hypothetical protein